MAQEINPDFEAICSAIDTGGGQMCDVEGIIKSLRIAGFEIVRIAEIQRLKEVEEAYESAQSAAEDHRFD